MKLWLDVGQRDGGEEWEEHLFVCSYDELW